MKQSQISSILVTLVAVLSTSTQVLAQDSSYTGQQQAPSYGPGQQAPPQAPVIVQPPLQIARPPMPATTPCTASVPDQGRIIGGDGAVAPTNVQLAPVIVTATAPQPIETVVVTEVVPPPNEPVAPAPGEQLTPQPMPGQGPVPMPQPQAGQGPMTTPCTTGNGAVAPTNIPVQADVPAPVVVPVPANQPIQANVPVNQDGEDCEEDIPAAPTANFPVLPDGGAPVPPQQPVNGRPVDPQATPCESNGAVAPTVSDAPQATPVPFPAPVVAAPADGARPVGGAETPCTLAAAAAAAGVAPTQVPTDSTTAEANSAPFPAGVNGPAPAPVVAGPAAGNVVGPTYGSSTSPAAPVAQGYDDLPFCDEVNPNTFTPVAVGRDNFTSVAATYGQGVGAAASDGGIAAANAAPVHAADGTIVPEGTVVPPPAEGAAYADPNAASALPDVGASIEGLGAQSDLKSDAPRLVASTFFGTVVAMALAVI